MDEEIRDKAMEPEREAAIGEVKPSEKPWEGAEASAGGPEGSGIPEEQAEKLAGSPEERPEKAAVSLEERPEKAAVSPEEQAEKAAVSLEERPEKTAASPEEQPGAQAPRTMATEYVCVDRDRPDPGVIARAGGILRRGGLVAFPTETVYGLGGDALLPEASRKIYAAKGRPSDNPLIVHIADMEALLPIAEEVPEAARRLADAWWPGPLTMVFRKTALVPDETSGGLPTVAVRMPSHPVAAALIRAAGGYIAAPSANASGRPSPTRGEHVREDLDGRIDMILDGGPVEIGLESTIVDFTEEIPMILRPGYINREMLEAVLGEVRTDPGILDAGAARGVRPKAPGMRYRHYAPRAPLLIVEGPAERVTAEIGRRAALDTANGLKVGIIAAAETAGSYPAGRVRDIGSRETDEEIARHLFEVLRSFDEDGTDRIYSEAFDTPRMGMAIMNRLLRAAGHHVLRV